MPNGVEKLKEMLLKTRNVVQVFLVDLKLNVDLDEWIRKGRALQIYLTVRELCPKNLSNMAPRKEMWVGSESLKGVTKKDLIKR